MLPPDKVSDYRVYIRHVRLSSDLLSSSGHVESVGKGIVGRRHTTDLKLLT